MLYNAWMSTGAMIFFRSRKTNELTRLKTKSVARKMSNRFPRNVGIVNKMGIWIIKKSKLALNAEL